MDNSQISEAVSAALAPILEENAQLAESLNEVRMMFASEDRFWQLLSSWSTKDLEGFDLRELKAISERIRPHVVGDSLVRRGAELHTGYVWSKGVDIEGVGSKAGPGRPTELFKFFTNPVNQESLFSTTAHGELQRARYADGNIFLACNKLEGTVRVIPLSQITAILVNPDFPSEVWAYQRRWTSEPSPEQESKSQVRWYYTSRMPQNKKRKSIGPGSDRVAVDPDTTIIDRKFNRISGYVLGIPDSIAMHVWVAAYNEILEYGRVVNEGLARILYKVISQNKNAAQGAAVKIANMTGHGNAASMVAGQDLQAVSTAGKGYEFTNARPIAAMAAAAINVPNVELLSDSSAAGSSYGAAATLSPATLNAVKVMQSEWVELLTEVFAHFGFNPRIAFDPIIDPDPYRAAQQVALLKDALSPEEYRGAALNLLNIAGDSTKIPKGLQAQLDLALAGVDSAQASAKQAASPDQGRSNGSGSGGSGANDLRSDQISQTLAIQMNGELLLEKMQDLVARFERISE